MSNLVWCSEVHCTFHHPGKQFIGPASFCRRGVGGRREGVGSHFLDLLHHRNYLCFVCEDLLIEWAGVCRIWAGIRGCFKCGWHFSVCTEFKETFQGVSISKKKRLYQTQPPTLLIHFGNWAVPLRCQRSVLVLPCGKKGRSLNWFFLVAWNTKHLRTTA